MALLEDPARRVAFVWRQAVGEVEAERLLDLATRPAQILERDVSRLATRGEWTTCRACYPAHVRGGAGRGRWMTWLWVIQLLLAPIGLLSAKTSMELRSERLATVGVIVAGLALVLGLVTCVLGLLFRRWWLALASLASSALSGGVAFVAVLTTFTARDWNQPPCAEVTVGDRHFALHSEADPIGYGPVTFQLFERRRWKRIRIDGCAVDISPRHIDPERRCALETSRDRSLVAFKQGGLYTQLLDVAAGRCRFTATEGSAFSDEIARALEH